MLTRQIVLPYYIFASDGPFMQKLAQFETCAAPSAGPSTRNTYKLTMGDGIKDTDRKKILDALCQALSVRFEDTKKGLVAATSIANFKVWPIEESDLEGSHSRQLMYFNVSVTCMMTNCYFYLGTNTHGMDIISDTLYCYSSKSNKI